MVRTRADKDEFQWICYAKSSCFSASLAQVPHNQGDGGGEIRTHEAFGPSGFQDRRNQPLCHPAGETIKVAKSVPSRRTRASTAAYQFLRCCPKIFISKYVWPQTGPLQKNRISKGAECLPCTDRSRRLAARKIITVLGLEAVQFAIVV